MLKICFWKATNPERSAIAWLYSPPEARALMDYLVSAEVEDALMKAGFCQFPVRSAAGVVDPAFAHIKPMDIRLQDICDQMPRAASELREIFVR